MTHQKEKTAQQEILLNMFRFSICSFYLLLKFVAEEGSRQVDAVGLVSLGTKLGHLKRMSRIEEQTTL